MTEPLSDYELSDMRRRWTGGGRSDEDYTDAGCRTLLRTAWTDIDRLIGEVDRLHRARADYREELTALLRATWAAETPLGAPGPTPGDSDGPQPHSGPPS